MTVKEIVAEWLKSHGYDGLFAEGGECACELADLMPCDAEGCETCIAGYKCKPGPDDDPDSKFVISAQRPEDRLRELLKAALPSVEEWALMADAMERHQVVPAENQARAMKAANDAVELALDIASAIGVPSGLAAGIEHNRKLAEGG